MNDTLANRETNMQLIQELKHVKSYWICFLLLGIVLIACGTVAIAIPPLFSALAAMVMGIVLMVSGLVTITSSFWIGRWSGMLLHILAGILYLVVGFIVSEHPVASAVVTGLFIAASFIVLGTFRIVSALVIRFPQWGWALINGIITLVLGLVIYRHFPEAALWILGILVGVELIFNGISWIMLSLAIRKIPSELPVG